MSPLQRGVFLGTPSPINSRPRAHSAEPIWDDGDGHLITFAPTGAGKGVSCIIPALLSWDGPAIVIDPKGENYMVTAGRRCAFGHRVVLLDPFGVTGSSVLDKLNPLDLITDAASAADDAATIAKLVTQGKYFALDPFWDERAETLITGLILYARTRTPALQNLAEVRYIIESSQREQALTAEDMLRSQAAEMRPAANILAIMAEHRVRASIISTASSHLSFLRSGRVQHATCASSFDLDAVRTGNKLTIFLVLPPDKLASHGKVLRLLARRSFRPSRPTLLLIDEAAQLGPLDELRSAITLMRGYGVRCWSFWQDLSQLKRTYPLDWQSLVNNCAVQQYFGLSLPQAAAEIDAYLGGASPRPMAQIADSDALLLRRGHAPMVVTRPDYLHDRMFSGTFEDNPFYGHNAGDDHHEVSTPAPEPDKVVRFPGRER
jgi:type IV secretion system protein VirD4